MTDPGLTDLIAAHRLKQSYWNWWGCTGCDWRTKGTYGSEPTAETATEHAKHVVEQHTNGRIAELEERARYTSRLLPTWSDRIDSLTARAEKAEATVARVEKALAEGPLHRIDFPQSKDPYGIERQTIRAALEGEQQ